MQEGGSVGWDPIYVHVETPIHLKLFILYLLVVLVVGVVRWIRLAWQAWFLPLRKRLSPEALREGKVQADNLAACALAGGLSRSIANPITAILKPGSDAAFALLSRLERARHRFLHAWEIQWSKIQALKRLVLLTILLSMFVLAAGATNALNGVYTEKGPVALRVGAMLGAQLFGAVAIGLFVSAVLYGAASCYESLLMRRKATWNYFCDKCRDELATEQVTSVGTRQAN
jgi:hypothetical protein